MNFQPVDRLPVWEWAMWWEKTVICWHGEGLPRELKHSQVFEIAQYLGLDPYQQFSFSTTQATIEATQHHTEGMVSNLLTIVDTDGDVTMLVPWLQAVGVDGVLPLERQAGEDGVRLRELYPELPMIGHYNKLVMHKGEAAIRAEFERLVPLMKTGGFIPSVDHQTPPGVSLEEYRMSICILKEYMTGAVQE